MTANSPKQEAMIQTAEREMSYLLAGVRRRDPSALANVQAIWTAARATTQNPKSSRRDFDKAIANIWYRRFAKDESQEARQAHPQVAP